MTDANQSDSVVVGIPKAGHVFTHRWTKEPHDPARCCAAVHDGGRSVGFHQCTRKPVEWLDVDHRGKARRLGYCRQHDPRAVAKAKQKRDAKYEAQYAADRAKCAKEKRDRDLREAAVEAIQRIADGHNDPRGLAQEVLARFSEDSPTPSAGGEKG